MRAFLGLRCGWRGSAPLLRVFLEHAQCPRAAPGRLERTVKCIQEFHDLWLDLDDVLVLVGALLTLHLFYSTQLGWEELWIHCIDDREQKVAVHVNLVPSS